MIRSTGFSISVHVVIFESEERGVTPTRHEQHKQTAEPSVMQPGMKLRVV